MSRRACGGVVRKRRSSSAISSSRPIAGGCGVLGRVASSSWMRRARMRCERRELVEPPYQRRSRRILCWTPRNHTCRFRSSLLGAPKGGRNGVNGFSVSSSEAVGASGDGLEGGPATGRWPVEAADLTAPIVGNLIREPIVTVRRGAMVRYCTGRAGSARSGARRVAASAGGAVVIRRVISTPARNAPCPTRDPSPRHRARASDRASSARCGAPWRRASGCRPPPPSPAGCSAAPSPRAARAPRDRPRR